jgi:uncharacterized RDD family membrane protein YckC
MIRINTPDFFLGQFLSLVGAAFFAFFVWRYYADAWYSINKKYLTFAPRLWTGVVDQFVLWPVGFLIAWVKTLETSDVVLAVMLVAGNIIGSIYTVLMHARYGQTCGKMVCKVKIVDHLTEAPVTFKQALLREAIPIGLGILGGLYAIYLVANGAVARDVLLGRAKGGGDVLFWVIASLSFIWFLAEISTMQLNDKRRALHDVIAGTVVVRTNIGPDSVLVSV